MPERTSTIGRWIAAILILAGLTVVLINVMVDNLAKGEVRKIDGYKEWSEETIRAAETIPVMDGGRVKPLSTLAGFNMLRFHGARKMKIEGEDGPVSIYPTAWMLDTLLRPHLAVQLPTFRVDNAAVLEAIGVKPLGRRDRYSYIDLESGRQKLFDMASSYEKIDSKARDPMQQQMVALAYNVRDYELLLGYLGFARTGIILRGDGDRPDRRVNVSDLMRVGPEMRGAISMAGHEGSPVPPGMKDLVEQIQIASNLSKFGLFLFPPTDDEHPVWMSAGNVIWETLTGTLPDAETAIGDIVALERIARQPSEDEAGLRKELEAFRDRVDARMEARDEGKRVSLEAAYYRANWFLNALVFFLIGSLSAFGMWAIGRNRAGRIFAGATWLFTVVAAVLCVIAITQRSIIMARPPVGNLYDTIIFIGTAVVLLSLVVELLTRRRFALGMAPILGTLLIVLARRYELGDAKDHMDPLVAVLDSNFWLTVHVITITLGYAAGLLAAMLSCVYVLIRGLRLDGGDRNFRKSLTAAVYGVLCLTLFLSLVGTVLGGIWANYSWGRFWGWDPKENGALMIVLWMLVILHARMGGYIREWGLHLASIFGACVVAFSWWHVNFLGVGLHNYGFTAGKGTIWIFYAVMGGFLLFGAVARFFEMPAKPRRQVSQSGEEVSTAS